MHESFHQLLLLSLLHACDLFEHANLYLISKVNKLNGDVSQPFVRLYNVQRFIRAIIFFDLCCFFAATHRSSLPRIPNQCIANCYRFIFHYIPYFETTRGRITPRVCISYRYTIFSYGVVSTQTVSNARSRYIRYGEKFASLSYHFAVNWCFFTTVLRKGCIQGFY